MTRLFCILFVFICFFSFSEEKIKVGAENTNAYLHFLENKKIGIVANQTSFIHQTHLVDSLISLGIDITFIFAPEHGFRGQEDAGKHIEDGKDAKTGLPIISLYGKNKKPNQEHLNQVDIIIFDIQDVGCRFYTYLSSLHYVMEACAETNTKLIVLDRPNPNAHTIDGPILEKEYRSFVGMHPIPVVYGCTLGEMAMMINGEKWLKNKIECDLTVIKNEDYSHNSCYILPIKPSPNLPNAFSIALYPSLCFFEGTSVSVGRGTEYPFQIVGSPYLKDSSFSFIPRSIEGAAKYPKHEDVKCYGTDFSKTNISTQFSVKYLLSYYQAYSNKNKFITNERFFNLLAGNSILLEQIKANKSEKEIKQSWKQGLDAYKKIREKYLLYK